jgi:hypothetical protein
VPTSYHVAQLDAERPSGHPRLFRFLAHYLREKGAPAPLP